MREGVTPKQQAYLDFIGQYVALHREAPAEADMVEFFRVSPPSVHRMVVTLADKGLISRTPGKGSCWGHGKGPAYLDLAVEGLPGLTHFVERLNRIDRKVKAEALFDVQLNWSEEVITSCAFDLFPNWIMLSWSITGTGRGRAPSAALLEKIARLYGRQR